MDDGIDFIVLSEHWLWPYDIDRLGLINDAFDGMGKADARLTPVAESGRGCGGVGILWRKSLGATVIADIESDRICGVRFTLGDGVIVSVLMYHAWT